MKLNKRNSNYISDIKQIISNAKKRVYSSVNSTMVQAYWLIGKRIVEEEQRGKERAEYGKQIINNVSKELTDEFGRGFSATNIRYFRQFFQLFPAESIYHLTGDELQNQNYHLTSDEFKKTDEHLKESNLGSNEGAGILEIIFTKLSWTHVRQILRVKNIEARNYYIRETAKNSWVVETLDRNIATQYYERLFLSHAREPVSKEMEMKTKDFQIDKNEFIKSPAILEFLNIPSNRGYTEAELEKAIIDNIQAFLLEMGKGYAFVERQQLVRTEAKDYFIDLVFYNYIIKCFVLIDLKTERITHQDVGQMDMYVRMYDENKKAENDNPTIGIVLCSETDQDIARYSILKGNEQIFASKYKLYLPTEEELRAEIEREKLNFKLQSGQKLKTLLS
jgi:predicted nuclease of restriction endonuclease-like (RecB) superfamily